MKAEDIRAALKRRFVQPSQAIVFEVAPSTGHGANRHVDAVMMDLYPSRGLALTAIEIKVDRGDFIKEVRQPEKSEAIAKFCDYFVIAAPQGMLKAHELPIAWGLYEITPRGALKETVKPRETPHQPVDRAFLAAMLRAASRPASGLVDAVIEQRRGELEGEVAKLRDGINAEIERQVEVRTRHDPDARDEVSWRAYVESLGARRHFLSARRVINATRMVIEAGLADDHSSLYTLASQLNEAAESVRAALAHVTAAKTPDAPLAASPGAPAGSLPAPGLEPPGEAHA